MRQTAALLALLALLSGVARAEGPGVKPSFTWPLPEGWKAETIPFPLEFAPDVHHTGVEELRFSPGFGDPAAPDNWTYAFAWVLEDKASFTAETLERELTAYFKGLSMAVGAKKFSFDTDHFSAHIRPRPAARASEARELFGTVETYDCFRTGKPITLHVVVRTVECEAGRPGAVLVAASRVDEAEANEKGSSIWPGLRRLLDDFRCGRRGRETGSLRKGCGRVCAPGERRPGLAGGTSVAQRGASGVTASWSCRIPPPCRRHVGDMSPSDEDPGLTTRRLSRLFARSLEKLEKRRLSLLCLAMARRLPDDCA